MLEPKDGIVVVIALREGVDWDDSNRVLEQIRAIEEVAYADHIQNDTGWEDVLKVRIRRLIEAKTEQMIDLIEDLIGDKS